MLKLPALLIPVLAGSTLFLTGALNPQSAGSGAALFVPQSPPTDASQLFDEALANFTAPPASPGAQWLSLTLWQKMTDGENSFEAEGRLFRGPKQLLRLEMEIKSQKRVKLTHACDGVTLRQLVQVGDEQPVLSTYLLPGHSTPATAAEREAFLEQHGIADFPPLLRRLREGMKNPVQEAGLWQGLPALRISGAWSPREDMPKDLRPPLRPRACHLYLDAHTRFPFRVEWWGSAKPGQTPALLVQMEFRDVVLSQPIAAEVFSAVPFPQ
jgi:hypothetical protein